MKKTIIALTLATLWPSTYSWADEVDCAITPYYGVCPICEAAVSEEDDASADLSTKTSDTSGARNVSRIALPEAISRHSL